MNEIDNVDSIIVICTPEYKKRYLNENEKFLESGVYKECKLIKERIHRRNEALSKSKDDFADMDFKIFPLVLAVQDNSSENSVPDFLTTLVREKINKI